MDLTKGIQAALKGHRQVDVAEAMGVTQNQVSRWNTGATRPSLEQIADIEDACRRPRGFILQAAGYLSVSGGVIEAIAMDPELDDAGRDILTASYRAAVEAAGRGR